MKRTPKIRIKKTPRVLSATLTLALIIVASALSSCNVTRTVTTQSSYFQKGDTTCTIITKTVETYDATKH